MDEVVPMYKSLARWIEESGYQLAAQSREMFHEFHEEDHSLNVAEIQMPVRRSSVVRRRIAVRHGSDAPEGKGSETRTLDRTAR